MYIYVIYFIVYMCEYMHMYIYFHNLKNFLQIKQVPLLSDKVSGGLDFLFSVHRGLLAIAYTASVSLA